MLPSWANHFQHIISFLPICGWKNFEDPGQGEVPHLVGKGFHGDDVSEAGGVCAGEPGAVESGVFLKLEVPQLLVEVIEVLVDECHVLFEFFNGEGGWAGLLTEIRDMLGSTSCNVH